MQERLRRCVRVWLLLLTAVTILFPNAHAQNNSGSALSLSGSDFIRANNQLSATFPDDNIAFEFWFRAITSGALVGEVDAFDVTQWDVLLAEVLPGGQVIVGFPGISPVIAGTVEFNTWNHLTFVYDDVNKKLTAFLNDGPTVTSTSDRISPRPPRDANYTLARGGPKNLGPGGWMTGQFDEVRMWKSAPGESFLRLHWNRFLTPSASGLATMWHFDVINGAFSPDSTSNNNPALYGGVGNMPLTISTAPVLPPFPTVETLTGVSESFSATLKGSANPNGQELSGHFEWGSTTNYGNVTPMQNLGTGIIITNFQAIITNLAKGDYHYRAVITYASDLTTNVATGGDQTFVISGPAGSAVELHGNDYFRASRQSTAIFDTDDFTFEVWFKAALSGVLINEVDSLDVTRWDYALAEVFPNGTIKATVPGLATMEVGTNLLGAWHHFALVYDVNAQALRAYLDGQLAGEQFGGRFTPKQAGRVVNYAFGRGGSTNLLGAYFNGLMDEIRIWKRPLSSEEIANAYNLRIVTFDSALKAYWHFDSIQGNSSPDATANNNSAVYTGPGIYTNVPSSAPIIEDFRPSISNVIASDINPEITRVKANIDTRNEATRYYFEFSLSNQVVRTESFEAPGATQPTSVRTDLRGLSPGVFYDIRVVASNRFGQIRGASVGFQKSGWAAYSLRFATPDYIRTASGQNTNFSTDSITVELWAKPSRAGVVASESNFPNTSSLDRSFIEILTNGTIAAAFDGVPMINLGLARTNQWQHIALRYDATTQTLDGFLDGVRSATTTGDRLTPAEKGIVGYLAFGKSTLTRLGAGASYGGEMDEIRVWNVPRSDSEIALNRVLLLTGTEPGLVLLWRLDDSDNAIISDASPRNNRGQNVGADHVVSGVPRTRTITPIRFGSLTEARLEFLTDPSLSYRLEKSNDLTNWAPVATNTPSSLGVLEFTAPLEQTDAFFRTAPIISP